MATEIEQAWRSVEDALGALKRMLGGAGSVPQTGQPVWWIDQTCPHGVSSGLWKDSFNQRLALERGLMFDNAVEAQKALDWRWTGRA